MGHALKQAPQRVQRVSVSAMNWARCSVSVVGFASGLVTIMHAAWWLNANTMPQLTAVVAQVLESGAHMAAGLASFSAHEGAREIVADHLARPATGWAVGIVGAVAEFMRTAADAVESDRASCVVTARGALRIAATPETQVVRFTTASGLACIALCLPEALARLSGRAVLTEVGRDAGALRAADRDAFLFDLGVQSPFFEFCIRTADPAAVRRLRSRAGTSLFGKDRGVLPEIAALQPHRVVRSKLARIEVYQPIADAAGATPDGPHTHLLPELLAASLPYGSDEPIPAGWIPCAHLYLGQLPVHQVHTTAH